MRRRSLLMIVVAAAALGACPGPSRRAKPAASVAPRAAAPGNGTSVLLITIDTLRADHLGAYGYRRPTSPRLDAFARRAMVFDQAYTYWPKTRGSFVAIHTGRLASQTGYGKSHPLLLEFNPTLAGVLAEAGYETTAVVDNPNVAGSLGYAKGFARYRETWEEKGLDSEVARARAITEDGLATLARAARSPKPFFLWLHYVNPHAPYEPPAPYDRLFLDAQAKTGRILPAVEGFHGGVSRSWKEWAKPGRSLGWYVAQYDGEIAFADAEVGRVLDALAASPAAGRTLVIVTSDHGESLGEHDYYFDHGENLFDPCQRIPLIVAGPGVAAGRTDVLASTLDLVPTVLDAVKVSYPPDLSGQSLLPAARGERREGRARLLGQNDRNLMGAWDKRFKVVATPADAGTAWALYDRQRDPGETRDAAKAQPERMREERRELEILRERVDAQATRTRRLVEGTKQVEKLTPDACERLKALGYVLEGCS
ncbi:MAG: sulfatase [Vicinamibacteria bacterium]